MTREREAGGTDEEVLSFEFWVLSFRRECWLTSSSAHGTGAPLFGQSVLTLRPSLKGH
jgi:hypothetical protein